MGTQQARTQDVPPRGAQTPVAAGIISGPTERMPGQESLDYAPSEGDAQRPAVGAERAAALDLDLSLPWTSDMEQLTL